MQHLKVNDTESTEDELILEGYIALYGGDDLTGERFTSDTNFDSDYTRRNVLLVDWEHGMEPDRVKDQPGRDDIMGQVDWLTNRSDDIGLLARHVLDRRQRYVTEFIEPLARAELIGSSSEATPKGISKSKDGTIQRWPLKRQSLTVAPAEPRLFNEHQLQVIKSLSESLPALKALLPPTDDQEIVTEPEPESDNISGDNSPSSVGDNIMSDETQTDSVAEFKGELEAMKDQLGGIDELKATLATVVKTLEKTPEPKKAGTVEVIEDEEDKPQFKSMGEFLQIVAEDNRDKRLRSVKSAEAGLGGYFDLDKAIGPKTVGTMYDRKQAHLKAAPQGLGELIPSEGGFLVDTDRAPGLMARMYDVGQLIQRAAMLPISSEANGMTLNAEDETSRVAGSRRGGIRGYWVSEAGSITASQPKFRQMELKLQKVAALVYATDELLADTSALEAYIMSNLPEELSFMVEDAIVRGTGAGQPLGILNSNAVVSVAKETGQAAATVLAENISKMWARRWLGARNYVWLINQDVEPELDNLNYAVGTGGALVYMPAGGLSGAPFGSIKGRPVIPVEYCATLGTVGDILLVDLNEYQMIEKGGVQSASSIHVRFVNDEQVFRFVYRVDGQPKWDSPLTPFQGTNTVSPFVSLATRA